MPNPATGESQSIVGHLDNGNRAAFLPRSRFIASGGRDRALRTWDLTTGDQVFAKSHPADVKFIVASPDGQHAVVALAGETYFYRRQAASVAAAKRRR